MSLFPQRLTPDTGMIPHQTRKTGLLRVWQMVSRDFMGFWLSGAIQMILTLPFVFAVGYACATHSILFALLAGVLGGMAAAPGFLGLADTLLRSLRDEPGLWWHRYSMAVKRGWKSSLLPGMLLGTAFSMQYFTLSHLHLLDGGLGLFLCQIISILLSAGLFVWYLPQQALLELGLSAMMKNSFLLFARYLPKTLLAVVILLAYAVFVWISLPSSVFLLLAAGLWLPLLCALQIIYPMLDQAFGIEEALDRIP